MTKPLRMITGRHYYRTNSHPRYAKPSVIVTLDCGHDKHYKGSGEPKGDMVHCDECPPRIDRILLCRKRPDGSHDKFGITHDEARKLHSDLGDFLADPRAYSYTVDEVPKAKTCCAIIPIHE